MSVTAVSYLFRSTFVGKGYVFFLSLSLSPTISISSYSFLFRYSKPLMIIRESATTFFDLCVSVCIFEYSLCGYMCLLCVSWTGSKQQTKELSEKIPDKQT